MSQPLRWVVLGALLVASASLIALMAHDASAATTYIDGDWAIDGDTTLSDGTWWVNGSISVTNATLTLERAELVVCSAPGVTGLLLDPDSYLAASRSTLRGGTTPLVMDLGHGGSLKDCWLSNLGDPRLGAGIKCRAGRLSMTLCNLTDGNSLIQGWSSLYLWHCRLEGYWGIGVEWTCEGYADVTIEASRFDGRSARGTAIELWGPGGGSGYPHASVKGCMFINSTYPVIASDFVDDGMLAIQENIATDCVLGPRILSAGGALTMNDNVWDCGGGATALCIWLGGEKVPKLSKETLFGTLELSGDGQAVEVSSFTITADYDGVSCTAVGLDISGSSIVAGRRDFVLQGEGFIHMRRCSHSYDGTCLGDAGGEIKELTKMAIANVTWQDGTPVVTCPLSFLGGMDVEVGTCAWGGPSTVEIATWWVTDVSVTHSKTVRALTRQGNAAFYSGPLDPFASAPVGIALVDDFVPRVVVLQPRPGAIVGGFTVSVIGDYVELGSGVGSIELRFDDGDRWQLADIGPDGRWNLTVASVPDGPHTLRVRITDVVGNSEELAVEDVTTDTTAPFITVIEPPPSVNCEEVRFVAMTEVGSRAYIGAKEVGVDANGCFMDWFTLEEGPNQFRLMAVDAAGNSFGMTYVVVLDKRAPTLVIERPLDGSWSTEDSIIVSGWTEEAATVTVNDLPTARVGTFFSAEVPTREGTLDVRVVAIDPAGNPSIVSLQVHVDRLQPYLRVESPSEGETTMAGTILVLGIVRDSGPVRVEVCGALATVGGEAWNKWVELEYGWNAIVVTATDAAGNMVNMTRRVLFQSPAPTLHATLVVGNTVVRDGCSAVTTGEANATLMVGVDQPCLLSVTGWPPGRVEPGDVTFRLGLSGGRNEIVVEATDLQGGRGTRMTFVVERDATPPQLVIRGPERYSRTESAHVTVWGYTEPGATVTINGTSLLTSSKGTFSVIVPLNEGVNEILIVSTDAFGNSGNLTLTVFRATPVPSPPEEEGPWRLVTTAAVGVAFLLMMLLFMRVMRDVRRAPRGARGAEWGGATAPPQSRTDAHLVPRVRRRQRR